MANDKITYGPHNLHPLSQMTTELVWEGKYDEYWKRWELDVAGCAMPLQRIETVDQPRFEAHSAGQADLFEQEHKRLDLSDAAFAYPKPGKYTACVKVVETFGCDISITVDC